MRVASLVLALALAGCTVESPCLIRSGTGESVTEAEVQAYVRDGGRVISGSVECDFSWCVRDESVSSSAPEAAVGYCTRSCELDGGGCPAGTRCETLVVGPADARRICVR